MIMASGVGSAVGGLSRYYATTSRQKCVFHSLLHFDRVRVGLAFARDIWFYVLVILLTCAFGGFAGITPSLGVDYFGGENIGTSISMLSVAILVSSFVSPAIVGALATPEGDLTFWNFMICAILALAGLVVARLNRNDMWRTSDKEA